MRYLNTDFLNKLLVHFWFLWWLIAFWTDMVGALAHVGVLHEPWAPDTNYPFLTSSLSMYGVPAFVVGMLFIGIILWSAINTIAFFIAALHIHRRPNTWRASACSAYVLSLSFWLAFFLADQLVMKFDLEQNHMVQGGFEFLCLLALYLLPTTEVHRQR